MKNAQGTYFVAVIEDTTLNKVINYNPGGKPIFHPLDIKWTRKFSR